MCRDCWNKVHPGVSSGGHEAATRFRVWETCCFCLKEHKSGIHVPKDRKDHSVKCSDTIRNSPYASIMN
jgi:hypothetical protein